MATWREATEAEVNGAKAEENTCFDGIMNGDETGVDCGGGDCPSCGGRPRWNMFFLCPKSHC